MSNQTKVEHISKNACMMKLFTHTVLYFVWEIL